LSGRQTVERSLAERLGPARRRAGEAGSVHERFQDRLESAPLLDGEARREADVIEVPILVVQPDQE
jgi:hypothetical protein